ncbi:MAG: AsmA-like C-terminal region-containing protein [Candidatus Avigastranaerophilus sp.]
MHIKTGIIKKFFKIAIVFAIFECLYLYALPPVLNHYLPENLLKNQAEKYTNASFYYSDYKISTCIKPDITVFFKQVSISDKELSYKLLNADELEIKISLADILRKKINIKNINSKNLNLYIFRDKNGMSNIEELFPKKENSAFKLLLKNNKIKINDYYLIFEDKNLDKSFIIAGNLDEASIRNKNKIFLKTKGYTINNNIKSEFETDISSRFPFSKEIKNNITEGSCVIYNINLDLISPYLIKFFDKNTKLLSGQIDYLQISTKKDNGKTQISVNTLLKDFIYDREDWTNNINIKGDCKISTHIEPEKNKLNIKSFSLKADKADIKAYGNIDFSDKLPELDITAQIKNSRAEKILAMLPQNLTKKLGTIEKVKFYKVYGDIEGKADIKGKIPQPDITGYVKGRNVHILDKSIHKLHKGTVDITFDKRKLYMDILVELFGGQNAKIKGYTYMYRDGINNVDIKTTDSIDLSLAQKIVIPISKVFNFMLGPVLEMDILSGKGIIDMNVQGSIDSINMNGFTEFRNASLTYNGLYGKVEKAAGRLDFKEDIIKFMSKQAYVKTNPLSVNGFVKINDNLDFNILSDSVEAKDALEIINNSSLLKDVKSGLALFTQVSNPIKLETNIKAKIVPVPFGHPPLPPEEAFEDMKVKGSVELFDNTCNIEGFETPIEHINGVVDFTETNVKINPVNGVVGTSPLTISGNVITDLKTKIPDVDITVTSGSVNLKDTIQFLTESYLYPKDYPDISNLYGIKAKHDLYFKYKAKSIDFVTDKAYAVMNFIPEDHNDPIKTKSGHVTVEKAVVTVDNVVTSLFDSEVLINGNVKHIDTLNPIYNLEFEASDFNLEHLNNTADISIMPEATNNIFNIFSNYQGFADINIRLKDNLLKGMIKLKSPKLIHKSTNIPMAFDDFNVLLDDKKIIMKNITASIGDIPFFGNFTVYDYYKTPFIDGFFTSKLTQTFIDNYLNKEAADKIKLKGDINLSSKISGTLNNLDIQPKLTLQETADISYENINLGDINEKREIQGFINLRHDNIFVKNIGYTKYISSQNNKKYPIKFMDISGTLRTEDNIIIPEEITLKTYKSMPARFLNVMLKSHILKQGAFNGNLKYKNNTDNGTSRITGSIDFRNIDIPLFDTVIKHIKLDADNENINLSLFGFLSEEKVRVKAKIKNSLSDKPQINSLNIYADKIDKNKLLELMARAHNAMNENNQIKNIDLRRLSVDNGHIEVKELIIKDFIAKDFTSDFSIDEKGMFSAENISAQIGEGTINGKMSYNLENTEITGNFELTDVDSNYVAETLFEGKSQIFGNANGQIFINTQGLTEEERIKNLMGYVYFDISDGRMPKLGSLEYLLRASNILKNGITGFTINSILELLNLIKTGYFSNINGSCIIENGIAQNIEIFSKGENLSLYIHGSYDINKTHADMEILGKLSNHISTIFGTLGNTSLNTFFKLIPGISLFDFSRKNFIEDVEKIPSFTNGDYEARIFQAIIDGNINESGYVQSFKWVK